MSDIRIILTETLREDYRRLPKRIQRKFDKQLCFLAENPKHPSLHIHRLADHWEFYVGYSADHLDEAAAGNWCPARDIRPGR